MDDVLPMNRAVTSGNLCRRRGAAKWGRRGTRSRSSKTRRTGMTAPVCSDRDGDLRVALADTTHRLGPTDPQPPFRSLQFPSCPMPHTPAMQDAIGPDHKERQYHGEG